MNKGNKSLTAFSDHLAQQYGKRGTPLRNQFEQEFEAFKAGFMLNELRKAMPKTKNSTLKPPKNEKATKQRFRRSFLHEAAEK